MDRVNSGPNIEGFERALQHVIANPRLILFGSRLLETYRDESDVDLIVVSDSFANQGLWERRQLIKPAAPELGWRGDIFLRSPVEWDEPGFLQAVVKTQYEEPSRWIKAQAELKGRAGYTEAIDAITFPCRYRSQSPIGATACTTSGIAKDLDVYGCAVHGRCVMRGDCESKLPTCIQCRDRAK